MTAHDIQQELAAVNRGLSVVEDAIYREFTAGQADRYGRAPAEMPDALRDLYENGTWKHQPVYLWDLVLSASRDGHQRASAADAPLNRLSFHPPSGLAAIASSTTRAEHSPVVAEALAAANRSRERVRKAILRRRETLDSKMQDLATLYQRLRREWLAKLSECERNLSPEQVRQRKTLDRELVMATRGTTGMGEHMSHKEIDSTLAEIQSAGGTCGGLSRWGSNLATIPDQDLSYCPSNGSVLVDDPLVLHYDTKVVNPWTRAERLLFLEKFLAHHKNFRRIATFFDHKSVDDVVRFYFDNKKQLALKQLTRDAHMKKRTSKKNALIELSGLPTESRSIKHNFQGDENDTGGQSCYMWPMDSVSSTSSDGISETRQAGRGWTDNDQQALIFALCRHKIDDDFSSTEKTPRVWCHIAAEVGTKTPAQCRSFYAHFNSVLALDRFQPPKPTKNPRSTKRVRTADYHSALYGTHGDVFGTERPHKVARQTPSPGDQPARKMWTNAQARAAETASKSDTRDGEAVSGPSVLSDHTTAHPVGTPPAGAQHTNAFSKVPLPTTGSEAEPGPTPAPVPGPQARDVTKPPTPLPEQQSTAPSIVANGTGPVDQANIPESKSAAEGKPTAATASADSAAAALSSTTIPPTALRAFALDQNRQAPKHTTSEPRSVLQSVPRAGSTADQITCTGKPIDSSLGAHVKVPVSPAVEQLAQPVESGANAQAMVPVDKASGVPPALAGPGSSPDAGREAALPTAAVPLSGEAEAVQVNGGRANAVQNVARKSGGPLPNTVDGDKTESTAERLVPQRSNGSAQPLSHSTLPSSGALVTPGSATTEQAG